MPAYTEQQPEGNSVESEGNMMKCESCNGTGKHHLVTVGQLVNCNVCGGSGVITGIVVKT